MRRNIQARITLRDVLEIKGFEFKNETIKWRFKHQPSFYSREIINITDDEARQVRDNILDIRFDVTEECHPLISTLEAENDDMWISIFFNPYLKDKMTIQCEIFEFMETNENKL